MKRHWMALAWILMTTGPVLAGPRLVGSADAPPLPAWVDFCSRHPGDCAVDPSQPDTVALTQDLRSLLSAVNRHVNKTVKPVTDEDHWGVADRWDYPDDGSGDCEDFQLLKRKLLVSAGVPRRALLMTVVIDELGEGHAVLTVRTSRGDLILDNRTDRILDWSETGYTFVKRESGTMAAGTVKWVYLSPDSAGAQLTATAP